MVGFDAVGFDALIRGFDRAAHDHDVLGRAARAWARRAQVEHASVAAFDRFSLGLLGVAAPADLLVLAHEAAIDEIAHARMSFAIAGAYGGSPLGPGPLDLTSAIEQALTLRALVESTVLEGCIGETLSALEARASADLAREPAARAALECIADDEARHSELAWAFVRWAIGMDHDLAALVARTFDQMLARATSAGVEGRCSEPDLNHFGLLTLEQISTTRRRGIDQVLVPAMAALRKP